MLGLRSCFFQRFVTHFGNDGGLSSIGGTPNRGGEVNTVRAFCRIDCEEQNWETREHTGRFLIFLHPGNLGTDATFRSLPLNLWYFLAVESC
jgi:hypothetical protein